MSTELGTKGGNIEESMKEDSEEDESGTVHGSRDRKGG